LNASRKISWACSGRCQRTDGGRSAFTSYGMAASVAFRALAPAWRALKPAAETGNGCGEQPQSRSVKPLDHRGQAASRNDIRRKLILEPRPLIRQQKLPLLRSLHLQET